MGTMKISSALLFVILLSSPIGAEAQGPVARLTVLEAIVATLQGQVSTLQGQVSTLEGQVSTLEGQVSTLEGQISEVLFDEVAAEESTSSHAATDLTTPGPSVTIQVPDSGLVAVYSRVDMKAVDGGGAGALAVVEVAPSPVFGLQSILSTSLSSFTRALTAPGVQNPWFGGKGSWIILEYTPGTAVELTLKYRCGSLGCDTATFQNRAIWAMPVK